MNQQIILMFSGQGSQYYQMGKELYDHYPRFRYWMDHCDEIVRPLIQTSIVSEIYPEIDKGQPFSRLLYTNPALISIEYSLARIFMEMGFQPDYLMGYSLGEITAAIVSGAISLEDGLTIAVELAKLVQEKTPKVEILALIETQDIMDEMPDLFRKCWVTGTNFKKNFVLSGLPWDIRRLEEALITRKKIYQKLPVKYGFHTQLIDPIEEPFRQLFHHIDFDLASIPIISSMQNEIVEKIDEDFFWRAIRLPVDFEKTVKNMVTRGDYIFIDAGPSGILATFVKYILDSESNCKTLQMINPFGQCLNSIEIMRKSISSDK